MNLYTALMGWMKPQHDRHQTVGIYANIITGRKPAISVTQTHTHTQHRLKSLAGSRSSPSTANCVYAQSLSHFSSLVGESRIFFRMGSRNAIYIQPNSKITKTPPTTTEVSDWSLHNTRSSRSSPIDRLPASVPCVGWLAGGRTRMTGLSRFQLGTIEDSSLD